MKEIEKLQRRIHWSECVHLALMTLLLSFPLTLTFQSDDRTTQILIALGTVIPVQLIRFLCERIRSKPLRLLSGLGVIGLSVLLTWSRERWSVYLICCVPILISGVFLPRSKGRILLTVPSPWAAAALVVAYGYGRSVETLGVPLIANIVLVLTALMVVNYFIHTSQSKLLTDIRMTAGTEISVSGMILQNRKTLFVFLLIGVLILTAIPFLLRWETPEAAPIGTMESTQLVTVPTGAAGQERDYGWTGETKPLHLEGFKEILVWSLALFMLLGPAIAAIAAFVVLVDMVNRKKKKIVSRESEGLTIERLDEEEERKPREKLTGWEKKLRRRYEKLILRRTPETAALNALTPTELERAAGLADRPETPELHELYARTRYGPELPDRETYRRFKELSKTLEHSAPGTS